MQQVTAEEVLRRIGWGVGPSDVEEGAEETSSQRFERLWRRARAARRLADFQSFEAAARHAVEDIEARARVIGWAEHRAERRKAASAQTKRREEEQRPRRGSVAAVVPQELRSETHSGVVACSRLLPWASVVAERRVAERRQEIEADARRDWGSLAPLTPMHFGAPDVLARVAEWLPASHLMTVWPRVAPLRRWLVRGLHGTDHQERPWTTDPAAPRICGDVLDLTQMPTGAAVRRLHRSAPACLGLASSPAAASTASRLHFVAHGDALWPDAAAAAARSVGARLRSVDLRPARNPRLRPTAEAAELPAQAAACFALYCDRLERLLLPRRVGGQPLRGDSAQLLESLVANRHSASLSDLRLGCMRTSAAPPPASSFASLRVLELVCVTPQCAAMLHAADWLRSLPQTLTHLDLSRPRPSELDGEELDAVATLSDVVRGIAHLAASLNTLRLRHFTGDAAAGSAAPRPAVICAAAPCPPKQSYLFFPAPAAAVAAAVLASVAATASLPVQQPWRCMPHGLSAFQRLVSLDLSGCGLTDLVCADADGVLAAPLRGLGSLRELRLDGNPVRATLPSTSAAAAHTEGTRRPGTAYCDWLLPATGCACSRWATDALPRGLRRLRVRGTSLTWWPPPVGLPRLRVFMAGGPEEPPDEAGWGSDEDVDAADDQPDHALPAGPPTPPLSHVRELRISHVPSLDALPELPPTLTALSVRHCSVRRLGREVGWLPDLAELDLRGNEVSEVDWVAVLAERPYLRLVDLRSNRLPVGCAPPAPLLSGCPALQQLLLSGNPCAGDDSRYGCITLRSVRLPSQLPPELVALTAGFLHGRAAARAALTCRRWLGAVVTKGVEEDDGAAEAGRAVPSWEPPATIHRLAHALRGVLGDAAADTDAAVCAAMEATTAPAPPTDPPPRRSSMLSLPRGSFSSIASDSVAREAGRSTRRSSTVSLASTSGASARSYSTLRTARARLSGPGAVGAVAIVRAQGFAQHWCVQYLVCTRTAMPGAVPDGDCTYRTGQCIFRRVGLGDVDPDPVLLRDLGSASTDDLRDWCARDPSAPRLSWFPLRCAPPGICLCVQWTRRLLNETVRGRKQQWQVYTVTVSDDGGRCDLAELGLRVVFEVREANFAAGAVTGGSACRLKGHGGSAASLLRRRRSSSQSMQQQDAESEAGTAVSGVTTASSLQSVAAVCGGAVVTFSRRGAGPHSVRVRAQSELTCNVSAALSPWYMAQPGRASVRLSPDGAPDQTRLALPDVCHGLQLELSAGAALDPAGSPELAVSLPATMMPFR